MVTFPAKKLSVCRIRYGVPSCSSVDLVLTKLGPVPAVTFPIPTVHFSNILQSTPRSHLLMPPYQHIVWRMYVPMSLLGMHFRVQWVQGLVFYGVDPPGIEVGRWPQ
jgi:hypothetical protein